MKLQTTHQERVEEFMRLAGQEVPRKPSEPSGEVRILRAKLIFEEAMETIRHGLGVEVSLPNGPLLTHVPVDFILFHEFSLVETIDGCCDLKVVTTGTLSACGIHDMRPQAAVDHNNLAKFGPGSYRREDGKWIKPPGHKPPDWESIIKSQEEA